ncbi:fungal-specific transcription factor domain-containing protein [Cladorrhinum samala]|uniref:Fungal-specific transcription factor domain-containing protein n=1 Tax=Cladorrhinum samala TaxID=585594 RepID=A0AAV9HVU4_9PEZI|nr:fungal-specific transcription factor domain-containing protein [Cladorrhinum samala]
MSLPPPADQRPILPMPAEPYQPIAASGLPPSSRSLPPGHKRTRVLLSCEPCRVSKQKCDREQPCANCIKKSREGLCKYAPRPEKVRPERSMAARLKRLEGMVREMMHTQQEQPAPPSVPNTAMPEGQEDERPADTRASLPRRTVLTAPRGGEEEPLAQVVVGKDGQGTYIGATHFMAMLNDIEDLKSYFDDDDETPEMSSTGPATTWDFESRGGQHELATSNSYSSPGILLPFGPAAACKQDLIEMLPPRHVVDRLIQRYFGAVSPSHHCVHRPTFGKQCDAFWHDPSTASAHWLSLLWIILALGTLLSKFAAPEELEPDSRLSPPERFRHYRSLALQALTQGVFTSPTTSTLQAILLYAESEFLVNRKTQMNCYIIISVCVRLMLRMGFHRDASKLPSLSPFEGEMRRRMWHMACQCDLLVSFHLGLPSMVDKIESDTSLPKNLIDSDFFPDSPCLPPPRPDAEYTPLTYPIWKSSLCQVFGLVAFQANSLTAPTYAEVMALDRKIEDRWGQVPSFMRQVRPPDNSITDSPHMLNQRFGLVSLYQKSRCVLHRRYLVEVPTLKPEHAYSRRTCLEAAVALLDYQEFMHLATLPGGALRSSGWFITSLAIHDLLLAAMVVYLVLLNEVDCSSGGDEEGKANLPDRKQLFEILQKSHRTWILIARDDPASAKAVEALGTMLSKLERRMAESSGNGESESSWQILKEPFSVGSLSVSDGPRDSVMNFEPGDQYQVPLSRQDLVPAASGTSFDAPWLNVNMGTEEMNWKTFDDVMSGQSDDIIPPQDVESWIEQGPLLPDVSLMASFGLQGPFV